MARLHRHVRKLEGIGLTQIGVMHVALHRGIHPLKLCAPPMFQYTGKDDVTKAIRADFFETKLIQEMLSLMFKGKIADFPVEPTHCGFSAKLPIAEVSISLAFSIPPCYIFWAD